MWLYDPFQSVQESEDLISQSKSLLDQLIRSCTSRGMSKQPASWLAVWKTGSFHPLQFGRISQRSMQESFEARLTSVTEDCRASRSLSPASTTHCVACAYYDDRMLELNRILNVKKRKEEGSGEFL